MNNIGWFILCIFLLGFSLLCGFMYQACDAYNNSDGSLSLKYYRNQTLYRCLFAIICGTVYSLIKNNDTLEGLFLFTVLFSVFWMISNEIGFIEDGIDALTYLSIATAISNSGALIALFIFQASITYYLWKNREDYDTQKVLNCCITTFFCLINIVLSFCNIDFFASTIILCIQACVLPLVSGVSSKKLSKNYY